MADLLIKGMEMPTNCPCELLGAGYDLCCSFAWGVPARVKEYYECCQNDTRPSWCPLVPVSPHGRLIDAEELKELFRETITGIATRTDMKGAYEHIIRASAMVIDMIDDAPTVMEANE